MFFAACALLLGGSGALAASSETQLYHPGYPPIHVTRLHRWDHSGQESMLQAEARWRRLEQAPSSSLSEIAPESGESTPARGFVEISAVQAHGLRRHHFEEARIRSEAVTRRGQLHHRGRRQVRRAASMLQKEAHVETAGRADLFLSKVQYTVVSNRSRLQHASGELQEESLSPAGQLLQGFRQRLAPGALPREGSASQAVTGLTSLSSQYVGPIGVGTVVSPANCKVQRGTSLLFVERSQQGQNLTGCHLEDESQVWVVFDTGSTNIWISSDLCQYGPCADAGRHRYNHTRSATYDYPAAGMELNVQFGTGCIKGPQAVDDFHIGPFTVFNQTFGMIEMQNGTVFQEVPFEGILGLAFKSMSANNVLPFFDNIIQQRALGHNEFAFYFSLDSVTANAVFWGGVDPNFYEGHIEYFPVVEPYYWAVELLSFSVGDKEFQADSIAAKDSMFEQQDAEGGRLVRKGNWRAILDTGTTFFTAEGSMFDEIVQRIPEVPCDEMTSETHPPITYTLRNAGGKVSKFVLTNKQYMTSSSGLFLCSPAFMRIDIPPEHGPAMVLGECFLRHYYSVFDRGDGSPKSARVGLAKSRHDKKPVDQLMQLTRGQQYFQFGQPQHQSI